MNFIKTGLTSYARTWTLQLELIDKINRELLDNTVLFVEHPPTITIGRTGKKENIKVDEITLKKKSIEVYEVDRGGDVTLHCPGQLVVYPLINLKKVKSDLHWFIRTLEDIVIKVLSIYNIHSLKRESFTGVWVSPYKKIASLGIGVRKWVTFHGISLNVNPELEYFSLIFPCGLKDVEMTSIEKETGIVPEFDDVINNFTVYFKEYFSK